MPSFRLMKEDITKVGTESVRKRGTALSNKRLSPEKSTGNGRRCQVVQQLQRVRVYRARERTRCVRPLQRDCGKRIPDDTRTRSGYVRGRAGTQESTSC